MKFLVARTVIGVAAMAAGLVGACTTGSIVDPASGDVVPETEATAGTPAALGGRAGSSSAGGGSAGTSSFPNAQAGAADPGGPVVAGGSAADAAAGRPVGGPDASAPDATSSLPPPGDGEPVPNGNAYVAVGYGSRRIWSPDGTTWRDPATFAGPFENVLEGVAIGDGAIVAVGMAGIFRSVDGKTWDHITNSFMTSVAYHDGVFLSFIDDAVHRSTDGGKTWTRKGGTGTAIHWRTAFGNGHWVAVGDKNQSIGVRKVSEDGITWHDYSDQVGFRLNSVAYGAGRFVTVGQGGKGLVSLDGKTWERTEDTGLGDFPFVAFGGGKFVVCAGRCRTSSDGKTWSAPGPTPGPSAQVFGNGMWVGVGGQYYTSPDGVRWTAHGNGATGLDHLAFGRIGAP